MIKKNMKIGSICLMFLTSMFIASCNPEVDAWTETKEKTYKNGDEFLWIPSGAEGIDSVVYYLDEKKIYKTETMPFVLRYKIENLTSGKHTFNFKSYIGGNTNVFGIYEITVE